MGILRKSFAWKHQTLVHFICGISQLLRCVRDKKITCTPDKTHESYMDVQYGSLQKGLLGTGCKQSSAPSGSMLKFLKSCVKCICKFCPTNKNLKWKENLSVRQTFVKYWDRMSKTTGWVFGHYQAVTYMGSMFIENISSFFAQQVLSYH